MGIALVLFRTSTAAGPACCFTFSHSAPHFPLPSRAAPEKAGSGLLRYCYGLDHRAALFGFYTSPSAWIHFLFAGRASVTLSDTAQYCGRWLSTFAGCSLYLEPLLAREPRPNHLLHATPSYAGRFFENGLSAWMHYDSGCVSAAFSGIIVTMALGKGAPCAPAPNFTRPFRKWMFAFIA